MEDAIVAKDYTGKELMVGDTVAYMSVHYKSFRTATILAITPQKVQLADVKGRNEYGYKNKPTMRYHYQVIKI